MFGQPPTSKPHIKTAFHLNKQPQQTEAEKKGCCKSGSRKEQAENKEEDSDFAQRQTRRQKTSIIINSGGGLYLPRWQENTMSEDPSDLILQNPSKKPAETMQEERIQPDLVHEFLQDLGKFSNSRHLWALSTATATVIGLRPFFTG